MFGLDLGIFTDSLRAAQQAKSPNPDQTTQSPSMDSLSYALGVLFATNLSNEGLSSVHGESLKSGFEATLAGDATMSASEADALVRTEMMKLKEEKAKATKEAGEAFLANNANQEGITTTDSGLQYRHTVEGTGASPDANDEVTVHYRGTLLDGTEFDSKLEAWRTHLLPFERRDPRMDRRLAADERRRQNHVLHSPGLGLRCTPCARRSHSSLRGTDLRSGAHQSDVQVTASV